MRYTVCDLIIHLELFLSALAFLFAKYQLLIPVTAAQHESDQFADIFFKDLDELLKPLLQFNERLSELLLCDKNFDLADSQVVFQCVRTGLVEPFLNAPVDTSIELFLQDIVSNRQTLNEILLQGYQLGLGLVRFGRRRRGFRFLLGVLLVVVLDTFLRGNISIGLLRLNLYFAAVLATFIIHAIFPFELILLVEQFSGFEVSLPEVMLLD